MAYPSGYAAQYVVLNSTIESNLSRVGQVKLGHANNFVTVATYDYLGTSGVVGTTLPEPGVYSNRFDSGGDSVQLDRWNRPAAWAWTARASTWPKTTLDARSARGARWQMGGGTGHRASGRGIRQSAAGNRESAIGGIGCRLPHAGCRMPIAGCRQSGGWSRVLAAWGGRDVVESGSCAADGGAMSSEHGSMSACNA
ncbi:MAG: hypothetical protein KIT54_09545 [Phycisphaeraceae bacterium]|nr:hypothetical protein [Phycisphaeraceae bacterium]